MIPVLHGVWAAAGGLVGDFEHIETVTVGAGGAANITFSSIAGTYKHLQIRGVLRSMRASAGDTLRMRANGDTGSNYSYHAVFGDGASTGSSGLSSQTAMYDILIGDTATATVYAGFVIDILDYASTSKNKTVRSLAGFDANGSGEIGLRSNAWLNSGSAITSLSFYSNAGSNLKQYSTLSLYGVK